MLVAVAASGTDAVHARRRRGGAGGGRTDDRDREQSGAPLLAAAGYPVLADTGAEVIAGSTRMAAGTAQRAALTALSTTIMLRLGRGVHRGRMVDLRVTNAKLRARAEAMAWRSWRAFGQTTPARALDAAGTRVNAAGSLRAASPWMKLRRCWRRRTATCARRSTSSADVRASRNEVASVPVVRRLGHDLNRRPHARGRSETTAFPW
ncbi:hypothetical protein AB5I41_26075 [Sphingomonas sp. MMS24-JH45]